MNEPVNLVFKDTRVVIKRFKEMYPHLLRRGMNYEPYDYMTLKIYIPGVGKLIYEYFGDKITWLERWTDERQLREREQEMRPELYERFCLIINGYMKLNNMTQQQFADLVGISRRSLNKYLNSVSIPKVSTMKQICKSINIEL